MGGWISLTRVGIVREPLKISVQVAQVMYFNSHADGGTVLTFSRRESMRVAETEDEVAAKIARAIE